MALKRWFSPNVFIYDRALHDEQQLNLARQAHWRQVELLFERIDTEPGTSNRYRPCEYRLLDVISAPRMSLLTFSACSSVGYKRQKKRRQRSSERQISPDAACDKEHLHGRNRAALTRRRRIAPTQCECFNDRRPDLHIINSETSISSLRLPFSRSLYSPSITLHDPSSPTTRIPQHHGIFYSDHSSPSPFCDEGTILESGWLEEIESGCSS